MTDAGFTISRGIRWRFLWALIVIVHIAASGVWWWLTPKGFSVGHSRFWVNSALPCVVVVVLGIAVYKLMSSAQFGGAPLFLVPAFWIGAGIAASLLFPTSSVALRPLFFPAAVGLSLLAWFSLERTRIAVFSLLSGALLAGFVAFSLQAPLPSTRPGNAEAWSPPGNLGPSGLRRAGVVSFEPALGAVSIHQDNKPWLQVAPLLGFWSRSPDRCWTTFAAASDRDGPAREFLGVQSSGAVWTAFYQSDFASRLTVNAENSKLITLESMAHLPSPIYSHLNNCCSLSFDVAGSITIVFSPCPDTPIEVKSATYPDDYPGGGRRARFAFLAKDGFHVVEGAVSNKGPYTELASGPLTPGERVHLTFIVGDTPLLRVEFTDWSREASLELSPTAGWGLPMNAISLWPHNTGCYVRSTLASTSVGAGWDSVGHREGTYRQRVVIELFDESR